MGNTRPYWKVIVSLTFSLLATALVIGLGVAAIRIFMPFVIPVRMSSMDVSNAIVAILNRLLYSHLGFPSASLHAFL